MSDFSLNTIIREVGVTYRLSYEMHLIELARRGISKKSLLQLSVVAGLSLKERADILPVSLRTIHR